MKQITEEMKQRTEEMKQRTEEKKQRTEEMKQITEEIETFFQQQNLLGASISFSPIVYELSMNFNGMKTEKAISRNKR